MAYTRKPLFRRRAGGSMSTYWPGVIEGTSTSSSSVPVTAILTEAGDPILTEGGDYLLTES